MHKIRHLLLTSASFFALTGCASMAPISIADTAQAMPELSTLSKLLGDAGLSETLRGTGPYTMFAPSNEAFKALPAATLASLSKDKEQLKSVLSYHVVPGKLGSADVKTGPAKSVQGASIALARTGVYVTADDALVTQADVVAANGVVHVVDRVLIPPKR